MGAGVSCNGVTMGRAMLAVLAVLWLGACAADKAKPVAQIEPAAAAAEPVYVPVDLYSPLGAYLAGRLAHNDGDGEAATNYLMRALEHDPDNADLLRQAFVAALSQGTMTEAIEIAKRLTDITPSSSVAGLTLVVDAMLPGNYNAAEERLSALPAQGYNTLLVPMVGAWVAMGQNKPAVAVDLLSALEDNNAFAVFHEFHLALINDLAGNREAAARAYKAAIDGQRGGSYRTVYAYGAFLERGGDADGALALYGDYQAANPDSVWFEAAIARVTKAEPVDDAMVRDARDGAAEALFGVSSALLQENAVEAAIVYARLAVHLRSGFDAGYMLLGEILEGLAEPDSAIEAYEHVSRQSPLAWTVRLKIADNLDVLDRVDEAVTMLRALAAERPERSDPLIALADLLRGKERWLESVAAYDEAFARIDELSRRHWRALYARGIALERSRQWARAEADFLTALELVPDQPFVLNYLGYSWVDQGIHLVRALDMIERAVDLRPSDGYIIDSLGWAHYRMGNFEDAVLHLERAIELRADDPTINDHLGDAYWKVGRRFEARFQWRRALTLDPDEEGMETSIRQKIKHGLVSSPVADGGS